MENHNLSWVNQLLCVSSLGVAISYDQLQPSIPGPGVEFGLEVAQEAGSPQIISWFIRLIVSVIITLWLFNIAMENHH